MPLVRLYGRTLFVDLARVLLLSLGGVSALMLAGGVMVEAAKHSLSPLQAIALAPYLLPPMLSFTLPTCALFAATVAYGRLAAQSELVALKAAGIHPFSTLGPGILVAGIISGLGCGIADTLIPYCHRALEQSIRSDLERCMRSYLGQTGELAERDVPYELYVRAVQGDRLVDPIFKARGPTGANELVIQAAEAVLCVHKESNPVGDAERVLLLRMRDGVMTMIDGTNVYFREDRRQLPLPDSANRDELSVKALGLADCQERAELRHAQARRLFFDRSLIVAEALLAGDPAQACAELILDPVRANRLERKSREARAEVHLRLAEAFAVWPFLLVGIPVSLWAGRREFLHNFFLCFLPIVAVYYPLTVLFFNLYKEGRLPSVATLWLPVMGLSLLATPLLWRLRRF